MWLQFTHVMTRTTLPNGDWSEPTTEEALKGATKWICEFLGWDSVPAGYRLEASWEYSEGMDDGWTINMFKETT